MQNVTFEIANRLSIGSNMSNQKQTSMKIGDMVTGRIVSENGDKVDVALSNQLGKVTLSRTEISQEDLNTGDLRFAIKELDKSKVKLTYFSSKRAEGIENIKEKDEKIVSTLISDVSEQVKGRKKEEIENSELIEDKTDAFGTLQVNLTQKKIEKLKEMGVEADNLSIDEINEIIATLGVKSEKKEKSMESVEAILSSADLPVISENVLYLTQVMDKMEKLEEVGIDEVLTIMKRNVPLTLDHVYKTVFSSTSKVQRTEESFSDEDYAKILEQNGLVVSEENIGLVKKMIENEMDITKENFSTVQKLQEMFSDLTDERMIESAIQNIRENTKEDIGLDFDHLLIEEQLVEVKDVIDAALMDENKGSIKKFLDNRTFVNIDLLRKVIEERKNNILASGEAEETEDRYRHLRNDLETIKNKMTSENIYRLQNMGIHIEFSPIQEVASGLMKADEKEVVKQSATLFEKVYDDLKTLKNRDFRIYQNTIILSKKEVTLGRLAEENRTVIQKYEESMTESTMVLSSVLKMTQNQMEGVLQMNQIDVTPITLKSAIILSMNHLEITQQNVNAVSEMETKLSGIINQISPRQVLELIREKIDPTEMDIESLLRYIEGRREANLEEENKKQNVYQKIARVLADDDFTSEEKSAVIGVYRILYKIDKMKDVGLGKFIEVQSEITVDRIYHATKHLEQHTFETLVGEDFGMLEELIINEDNAKSRIRQAIRSLDETSHHKKRDLGMLKEHIENRNIEEKLNREGLTLDDLKAFKQFEKQKTETQDIIKTVLVMQESDELRNTIKKLSEKTMEKELADVEIVGYFNQLKDLSRELLVNEEKLDQIGNTSSLFNMITLCERVEDVTQIPIYLGDELTVVNIYVANKGKDKARGQVHITISLNTKSLGETELRVELNQKRKELKIEMKTEQTSKAVETEMQALKDGMKQDQYTIRLFKLNGKSIIAETVSKRSTRLKTNFEEVV